MKGEPGLSWPAVQRVNTLSTILESFRAGKEENKMIDTVVAIIKEYRSGTLDWHPGLVTYWNAGTKICQPRPFLWEEFAFLHDEHNGYESFWVEGVSLRKSSFVRTMIELIPDPQLNGPGIQAHLSFLTYTPLHARTTLTSVSANPRQNEFLL